MRAKYLIAVSFIAASISPATAAITDTFCGPDNGNGCLIGGEKKVFLQKKDDTLVGFGNIGGQNDLPVLKITSDGGVFDAYMDLKDGFSTIKPTFTTKFNGVDFTIPGYVFTELVWHSQLTKTDSPLDQFTAEGFSGTHKTDGFKTFFDKADNDVEYSITAVGGFFDEVNLLSLTGFKEIKQIEIGGLALDVNETPLPPAALLFASALGGLGFLGWRKKGGRSSHTPA